MKKTVFAAVLLCLVHPLSFAATYELKVWRTNNQDLRSLGKYSSVQSCRKALDDFKKANPNWTGGCFNV